MEKIPELLEKLKNNLPPSERLWLLINLAEEYWKISDYNNSKEFAETALTLSEQNSDLGAHAFCCHILGTIYSYLDIYDKALEYYYKAQKENASLENAMREAESWNGIADIYIRLGNIDKALSCFRHSYQLYPQYERTLNNLGYIEMLKNNFEEAISFYKQAENLAQNSGKFRSKIISMINISDILCKQNRVDEALQLLHVALDEFHLHEIPTPHEILASIYLNMGVAFGKNEQHDDAFRCFSEAKTIAETNDHKDYLQKSYHLLSIYYHEVGNHEMAWNMLLEYTRLNSRLISGKVVEKSNRIQNFYEKETRELISKNMTERSSRLATMGILSTGLTHEINQPLSAIRISAESILYWIKKEEIVMPMGFEVELRHIIQGTNKIEDLLRQLSKFWNSGKADPVQTVDLSEILDNSIGMLSKSMYANGIVLKTDYPTSLDGFQASEIHIQQIFINLLSYLIGRMAETPNRQKTIKITATENENCFKICFLCNHSNMPNAHWEQLFNPLFDSGMDKEVELGLSIVKYYSDHYYIDITGLEGEDEYSGLELIFLRKHQP